MKVTWDASPALYKYGVSQAVIYPEDSAGVAWNGLISVTESAGQSQESRYFDGQKYLNRLSAGPFSGSISAYTYPAELESYIGIENVFRDQVRRSFGLTYRINDEIHIVYNVLLAPSKRDFLTTGSEINPIVFDWNFTTLPEKIPGGKPTSHIVILKNESDQVAIANLEDTLYGDDLNDPSLPSPEDIIAIFETQAILQITDNGDGTYTASGPDNVVTIIDANTFSINWASVTIIDPATFSVSSL